MLSIELSRQNDFLAGSEFTVTCNITVDYTVDTPFIVNITWTMTNSNVYNILTNTTDRITVLNPFDNTYSTQVIFSTLSSSVDSGMYTCNVSIISVGGYNYVSNADTDAISTNLTVIGKLN